MLLPPGGATAAATPGGAICTGQGNIARNSLLKSASKYQIIFLVIFHLPPQIESNKLMCGDISVLVPSTQCLALVHPRYHHWIGVLYHRGYIQKHQSPGTTLTPFYLFMFYCISELTSHYVVHMGIAQSVTSQQVVNVHHTILSPLRKGQ